MNRFAEGELDDGEAFLVDLLGESDRAHPMERDENGVLRFRKNKAVCFLQEHCKYYWNEVWKLYQIGGLASEEDFKAVHRLLGYPVEGYLELFDAKRLKEAGSGRRNSNADLRNADPF